MKKRRYFNNLAMFVLAWLPVFNIYKSPLFFGYGTLLLLLFILFAVLKYHSIPKIISLPAKYYVLWLWCAIAYFISCLPQIKIGALIPGGLSFLVFSIELGFIISFFDISFFKHHTRVVVVIAGVILILQELMFFTTGSRFTAILPFGQLMDDMPVGELIDEQMKINRSCSLFREPAHFAQYLLPLLCLDLFSKENREKLITPYSFFIAIVLVLLRSGNGLLGLILLMTVKVFYFIKKAKVGVVILAVIFAIPIGYYAVTSYLSTEVGTAVLERSSELENDDSAGSYIRIYRGYALYSEMPTFNKIVGMNDENLLRLIPRTSISFLFRGEDQYDLYMNGVQTAMIHYGLIGLLLIIWFYLTLLKGKSIMPKIQICLLLLISLLGQTFLESIMLYCTVLAITDTESKFKKHENSLLYKA
jgi:hypothetical protein